MNKLINSTAQICAILFTSVVFAIVLFYVLRATHFFSSQQLENVTLCATLVVSFLGCLVLEQHKKA
jgi:ABC-type phosphate transport system permease subunit